jgi:hypothetical protein
MERLELRAVRLDDVGLVVAGARFGDRALQHLSEFARQVLSLTPYFFSNAAPSAVRSSGTSEV